MSDEKKTTVKKQWVELLTSDHTHFGKPCKKGDVIEVRDDQARRLIDAGQAKPTAAPKHD